MIPISKPHLTTGDFLEIKKAFDSSWISSKSPWIDKFERAFAKKVSKTRYAVAVNSGTSAIFLALKALKVGVGDEVIIPTFTMVATVNAVVWAGAKPVLVDSTSFNDWNIDPEGIKKKITKKTKAIIPVHIYGYPADMVKIKEIANRHNLYIVEDAAEAIGALYQKKPTSNWADVSCFSLYVNKIITTGNGGMVAMNNKNYYKMIKKLEFFDFNEKIHFKHHLIGYNLVLSGLQAALGLSQVKRFERLLAKRRIIFNWYRRKLNNTVKFIEPPSNVNPNFWFPAIIARDKRTKTKIVNQLKKHGVETREFFLPIHLQPTYKNVFHGEKYPVSEYFFERGILLPSYFDLSLKDVVYISKIINKIT